VSPKSSPETRSRRRSAVTATQDRCAAIRILPGGRKWRAVQETAAWGAFPFPVSGPPLLLRVGECQLPSLGGRGVLAQPLVAPIPRSLVEMAQEARLVALI
jgi:hypothetical protein